MAWSRSQKPCETVRSILAKTSSLDVTNPVQKETEIEIVDDHHIHDLIDSRDWSKCIQNAPNNHYVFPDNVIPINNEYKIKIIHRASTRLIYNFCYEFCQLCKNGLAPQSLFSNLNRYFYITSYNLSLGAILIC